MSTIIHSYEGNAKQAAKTGQSALAIHAENAPIHRERTRAR